jgi:putative tributyrin esterase
MAERKVADMALLSTEIFSESLTRRVSISVILPDRGTGNPNADGHYPVLWLLHGASDDCTSWYRFTSLERYLKRVGIACIMPSADLSFYANIDGGRYLDYVALELPAICQRLFPISADPRDNFLAGMSMGGYGTMKIGFTHPEKYAALGIFSSANFIDLGLDMAPGGPRAPLNFVRELVFGTYDLNLAHGTEFDLLEVARQAAASGKPLPRIFSVCGTEDSCHDENKKDIDYFRTLGFDGLFMDGPGMHDFDFWDPWLPVFLQWLPVNRPIR